MDTSRSYALKCAVKTVEAYCGRWFRNNQSESLLMLCGEVRTGKTHLAKKIHRFAVASAFKAFEKGNWGIERMPSVDYIAWPELARQLSEKNWSYMEDAYAASLLVLDDIGSENDPWKICADVLCQILSRREKMFTVVTTNVMPGGWAEKFDVRICDRFLRNSVVVDLSGVRPYMKS